MKVEEPKRITDEDIQRKYDENRREQITARWMVSAGVVAVAIGSYAIHPGLFAILLGGTLAWIGKDRM